MKILYFSPHPHLNLAAPSGPGTHMREVIRAFENRGHTVVRWIAGGEIMDESSPIAFRKNRIRKIVPSYLWQTLKDNRLLKWDEQLVAGLRELVQKEKPDLIYERGYYLMSSGVRVAEEFGIRHFIELNAPYPEEKMHMEGRSWYIAKADDVEKLQCSKTDLIVTVSSALKNYFVKRTGVDPNKVLVTPNAVKDAVLMQDHADGQAARTQLGFQDDHLVIGFVGSIFPYHGVDELIQSFIALASQRNDIRLLIVGDGEILPSLRELIVDARLESRVVFTGNVPHRDVFRYISAMDITVMARSNWYGSPVKIFEYGAMKKLIIAPDEIPVHDVMQHGVTGLILGSGERSLTNSLHYAIDHPKERQQMATTFFNQVKERHTWQHVGDAILAHFS